MERRLSLVTSSTLLGNLLLDSLTRRGEPVRALLVRQKSPQYAEEVPGCEVFHSDRDFSTGIDRAMEGVDTVYHLTVLLGGWRRDVEEAVIRPTVARARQVVEAAARQGVRRVVLCGAYIATDYARLPRLDPESWNEAPFNYYDEARTLAERAAWEVATAHGLPMVSLLAARMIGPYAFAGRLTASVALLQSILWNQPYPLDFNFHFNFVDAQNVADAALAAADRGEPGKRYLLVNERFLPLGQLYEMAKEYNPKARTPWRPGKRILGLVARLSEGIARATNREPFIFRDMIEPLYGKVPIADCAPARRDLGFVPGDPEALVRQVYAFLVERRAAARAAAPAGQGRTA